MSNYSLRHFFRIRNNLYTPILLNKTQQSMPKSKGSTNKITSEVKEQLQKLIDEVVNRIDVDSMTTDQKLKLSSFHYIMYCLTSEVRKTQTRNKRVYPFLFN